MPPWLTVWIARWLSGERFRKATSRDYRIHFAGLFFTGAFVVFMQAFGQPFMNHASAFRLWLAATVTIIVLLVAGFTWARFCPAALSLALGIIAWGAFVCLALRHSL